MFLKMFKSITLAMTIAALSVLLYLSRNDFILSSGSDALTTIVRPVLWAQVLSLLFVFLSLYTCFFLSFLKARVLQCVVLFVSMIIYFMSIHSFVIDVKTGSFRDVWGVVEIQRLPFDYIEGPAHDVTYDTGLFWLHLYRGEDRIHIFLGIIPWRINAAGIMRTPFMVNIRKHK